jgi:hypothetical protein
MAKYLVEVRRMEKFFNGFEVRHVPHLDNRDTNHLAWIASSRAPTPPDVIVEKLSKPSVKPPEVVNEAINHDLMVIDEPEHELAYDWMNLIKMFLENQPPSDANAEVERIVHKSKQYHLIDVILFRRGSNEMIMMCISREEGIHLLRDIYNDICGSHSSWCSIIGKAFKHGFYCPAAKDDVMKIITKCRACQFFQKETTKHTSPL